MQEVAQQCLQSRIKLHPEAPQGTDGMSENEGAGVRQQGAVEIVMPWGARVQEEGTADTQVPLWHISPENT